MIFGHSIVKVAFGAFYYTMILSPVIYAVFF